MPKKEITVTVPQKNLNFEVRNGSNLMQALLKAGLPVASSCLGDGICGKCRVAIKGKVNLANDLELQTLTKNNCDPDQRLACQVIVVDPIEVKTTYW